MEPTIKKYATHPVLLIAALAVILFCGVGIAAVMGWLPKSGAAMGPPLAAAPAQVAGREMGPPPAPANYAAAQRYANTSGTSGEGSYGGGAAPAGEAQGAAPAAAPELCHSCGVVESVHAVTQRGQGSGLGAAGGAIVGGLLGNQIGGGSGRKLATVAGAVGGAVVGNQVEGNMKASTHYSVRVRMDDGKVRTISSGSGNWEAGEHVKIVNGHLQRR